MTVDSKGRTPGLRGTATVENDKAEGEESEVWEGGPRGVTPVTLIHLTPLQHFKPFQMHLLTSPFEEGVQEEMTRTTGKAHEQSHSSQRHIMTEDWEPPSAQPKLGNWLETKNNFTSS